MELDSKETLSKSMSGSGPQTERQHQTELLGGGSAPQLDLDSLGQAHGRNAGNNKFEIDAYVPVSNMVSSGQRTTADATAMNTRETIHTTGVNTYMTLTNTTTEACNEKAIESRQEFWSFNKNQSVNSVVTQEQPKTQKKPTLATKSIGSCGQGSKKSSQQQSVKRLASPREAGARNFQSKQSKKASPCPSSKKAGKSPQSSMKPKSNNSKKVGIAQSKSSRRTEMKLVESFEHQAQSQAQSGGGSASLAATEVHRAGTVQLQAQSCNLASSAGEQPTTNGYNTGKTFHNTKTNSLEHQSKYQSEQQAKFLIVENEESPYVLDPSAQSGPSGFVDAGYGSLHGVKRNNMPSFGPISGHFGNGYKDQNVLVEVQTHSVNSIYNVQAQQSFIELNENKNEELTFNNENSLTHFADHLGLSSGQRTSGQSGVPACENIGVMQCGNSVLENSLGSYGQPEQNMEEMVVLVGSRMNFGNAVKGNNWDQEKVGNFNEAAKQAATNKQIKAHMRQLVSGEDEYMDRQSMAQPSQESSVAGQHRMQVNRTTVASHQFNHGSFGEDNQVSLKAPINHSQGHDQLTALGQEHDRQTSSVPSNHQSDAPRCRADVPHPSAPPKWQNKTAYAVIELQSSGARIMTEQSPPSRMLDVDGSDNEQVPGENVTSSSPERREAIKIGRFEAKARHLAFADSKTVRKGGARDTEESEQGTTGTNAKSITNNTHNRSSSSLGPSSKTPTILEKLRMVKVSGASRKSSKSQRKSRPPSASRTRTGALASARSFTNTSQGRSQFLATQPESRPRTPGSKGKSPIRLYATSTFAAHQRVVQNLDERSDRSPIRGLTQLAAATAQISSRPGQAVSFSCFSHANTRSLSRGKGQFLPNTRGVAVFKGGGIASQLTPVSKRFAPQYASSHSLVANAIGYTVSKNMKETKRVVHQTLAPKHDELVKGLNNMVDEQLQQVVEKINKKRELEKQNRDLRQKLQKRQDEVNSLEFQGNQASQNIEEHAVHIRGQLLAQVNELKHQLQFLEQARGNEIESSQRELDLFRAERDDMSAFIRDRKESLLQAQGHANDTALHDQSSITYITSKLHEAKKTHEYLALKHNQLEKTQIKQIRGAHTKKEIVQELHDNEYIESTEVAAELNSIVSRKGGTIPRRQYCRQRQDFMHTQQFSELLKENRCFEARLQ